MFQELTVDLRRQPEDRWHLTPAQRQPARELLALYKTDLGLLRDLGGYLTHLLGHFRNPLTYSGQTSGGQATRRSDLTR